MSSIKGICFDLGSTLLRFDGSWNQTTIQQGMDRMVAEMDHPKFLDPVFQEKFLQALEQSRIDREHDHIERPTRDTLRTVFQQHTGLSLSEAVLDSAMQALYSISQLSWKEMPGMRQVLEALSKDGYLLSIISNAADAEDVHRLIDRIEIRSYFDPIYISAEVRYRKPRKEIFNMLLDAWGLPPETLVMVGDTLNADIIGAQQAGMHQIWLERDLRPHENPEDRERIIPEKTASSLEEVPGLVRSLA